MQTLLIVAIVVTALAIIVQAGILVSMYLLSRRLTDKAEMLMDDSRKLMAPLEAITSNLKAAANDIAAAGKTARAEMLQLQQVLSETQESIRGQISDVGNMVLSTVYEARTVVMRPVRQYAAIAEAIAAGVRTLFKGRRVEPVEVTPEERPAA